jgi:hypothetical protein
MVSVIENTRDLAPMLAAPRAMAVVAVDWSPWHRRSVPVLEALEASQAEWSPNHAIRFFLLWPEHDEALNRWYEEKLAEYPQLELHGHGYAPLWWLRDGAIVDCLTRPYELPLAELQMRSTTALQPE